ncbi:hypothetical protein EJB05_09142 [Eragrostis curvula]|uniref:Uncharacterized protein n=1 Tax=Eragrostis curvula TaxID=38414 RepID=A0A5J9W421_9POAL|nr:hypothetical protein EJB05_09142 [Eragrostis curvula]
MAMVSSSTGPINSVLHKLPVSPEFRGLTQALEGMKHQMLGFCVRGVLSSTLARRWLLQLREIAYDVEEWLDERLIHSGGRFQLKACSSADLAKIQKFKDRITDVQNRGKMFGLHIEPSEITVDPEDEKPRKLLLKDGYSCKQMPCLVDLSGSESEIVQHLMDDEEELKVVAILGPGGLGKTTLARYVFQKQQSNFDRTAFVYVGRNPSTDATLMDIARQVMPKSLLHDENIALRLYEFLRTKRYLIVIDSVWSVMDWTAITCALPDNNLGSRIVATTEMQHVANSCCIKPIDSVLLLQPLDDTDSRKLMLNRFSLLEEDCLPDSSIFQSSMFKMFGGNPLALGVAAGLIATKSAMLSEFRMPENSVLVMKKILNFGYADLPLQMKSCFLYLGVFPENKTIMKDRLIRRWIAEGFLHTSKEESERLTEIGERYFIELGRRGLIDLVFRETGDEAIGCTVNDVIHDFILSLSREENFFTMGEELCSGSYPCEKIRRFAHDCNRQVDANILVSSAAHLAGVRSVTVSGDTNGWMHLSAYKVLRVLDLEDASGLRSSQLRSIGSLLFLSYLGLKGSDVTALPREIKALEQLTTIDIRNTSVKYLPELGKMKLVSLLADHVVIPRGIETMNKLEELETILICSTDDLDRAAKLIKNSKLMALGVILGCADARGSYKHGLIQFLAVVKESNLHTLFIDDHSNLLLDCWGHTRLQQMVKFRLKLSPVFKVPGEMAYLKDVTHLHIEVDELEAGGLSILASLPNLLVLSLISRNLRKRCMLRNQELEDCFHCLRVFKFNCLDGRMGLNFGPGVMPQLRRFELSFDVAQTISGFGDLDFGIQHLTCLLQVDVYIKCCGALPSDVENVKAVIRGQVTKLPNNPLLNLKMD